MTSIYFLLFIGFLANVNSENIPFEARIYSNLAEIVRPLENLPLEFPEEIWSDIRSDSITLLSEDDFNITLKTITEKKKSFNGTEIYIRSPISSDKTTTTKLIKAILIDEDRNLVKINDESIVNEKNLYFTVSSDQIYYLDEPKKSKYYVDFKYTPLKSPILVSYLRSSLHWRPEYQMNLLNDKSELIAMANIRNDGKLSLSIEGAELIGGDINLQSQRNTYERAYRAPASFALSSASRNSDMRESGPQVNVEQGEESAGLYSFSISKPFKIDAKTNYIVQMFRPRIFIERYGLFSRYFSPTTIISKAQRSYRLISDKYLPQGQ